MHILFAELYCYFLGTHSLSCLEDTSSRHDGPLTLTLRGFSPLYSIS